MAYSYLVKALPKNSYRKNRLYPLVKNTDGFYGNSDDKCERTAYGFGPPRSLLLVPQCYRKNREMSGQVRGPPQQFS